ncbi:MAG: hypothetical protein VKI42_06630 [Synechococcaceae cyanobacterium]|nr:hypothetical protein [Synechococcaceae cyanobacterium]
MPPANLICLDHPQLAADQAHGIWQEGSVTHRTITVQAKPANSSAARSRKWDGGSPALAARASLASAPPEDASPAAVDALAIRPQAAATSPEALVDQAEELLQENAAQRPGPQRKGAAASLASVERHPLDSAAARIPQLARNCADVEAEERAFAVVEQHPFPMAVRSLCDSGPSAAGNALRDRALPRLGWQRLGFIAQNF